MSRTALLVEQNWNAVPGGTARATNRLLAALVEHTDIEPVGVHGIHRKPPTLPLANNVEMAQIPLPGRLLQQMWSRGMQPAVDRFVDADVVHAPAYVLPPSDLPMVVTIHDLAFVRHPEWFTSNGVRFLTRFLDRVRASDALVAVPSAATAEDCVSLGIDAARVRTIPWGIDIVAATADDVERVRNAYDLPETFVLYVGTREPRKNLPTLIAAMAKLMTPLVIAGPDGWGDIDVRGATVLGEVPEDDLAPLMSAATVLAYPSHMEGFGLPVLEAMAQGTAVLVTQNTAPAEIAGDGGVAVSTHSSRAIADALDAIIGSPHELSKMGQAGRHRAGQYRWADTAQAHADMYKELK